MLRWENLGARNETTRREAAHFPTVCPRFERVSSALTETSVRARTLLHKKSNEA